MAILADVLLGSSPPWAAVVTTWLAVVCASWVLQRYPMLIHPRKTPKSAWLRLIDCFWSDRVRISCGMHDSSITPIATRLEQMATRASKPYTSPTEGAGWMVRALTMVWCARSDTGHGIQPPSSDESCD